jgi:hypothetical protein
VSFPIRTVAPVEIFASKIVALSGRGAARDLYDLNNMVYFGLFDEQEQQQLRKSTVLYLAIAGDTGVCGIDLSKMQDMTERTIKRDLLPMIRGADHFDLAQAKERVSNFLYETMKLTDQESKFLSRFYTEHYEPQLLFDDSETIARLEHHPMAMWRMTRISKTR